MEAVEIWNKINESARIFAWPGVVVFTVILFKAKLGSLLQRLREADTPAGTVKFDPSDQSAANSLMEASASSLVETVKAEIEAASKAGGETPAPIVEERLDLREIKDEVEDLITTSFAAGFDAARKVDPSSDRMRKAATPSPVITWNGSEPQVAGYSGVTDAVHTAVLREERGRVLNRRRLLTEIIERTEADIADIAEKLESTNGDKDLQTELLRKHTALRGQLGRRQRDLKALNNQLAIFDAEFGEIRLGEDSNRPSA
ncbi:hypothetical protein [Kribbella albertanoniae]|uniref:Uncharacterized protein n=1 Tax=Kribbella albertanoniae TaxID=1266829 RepID=A0A4R4Q6X5_9ACTN|nr:hypothetical protein [Kribbella albertanoniae]TDC30976.1 hypothetical protein E1261_12005 [Kribbella albertanoniae]